MRWSKACLRFPGRSTSASARPSKAAGNLPPAKPVRQCPLPPNRWFPPHASTRFAFRWRQLPAASRSQRGLFQRPANDRPSAVPSCRPAANTHGCLPHAREIISALQSRLPQWLLPCPFVRDWKPPIQILSDSQDGSRWPVDWFAPKLLCWRNRKWESRRFFPPPCSASKSSERRGYSPLPHAPARPYHPTTRTTAARDPSRSSLHCFFGRAQCRCARRLEYAKGPHLACGRDSHASQNLLAIAPQTSTTLRLVASEAHIAC